MKRLNKAILVLGLVTLSACSSANEPKLEPIVITKTKVIPIAAPAPDGVVRYCWEEPIVKVEKIRPGIDSRKEYYRPGYEAVRKVRSGRWRPCKSSRTPISKSSL